MATQKFASLNCLFEDDSIKLARQRHEHERTLIEKVKPEIDYSLSLSARLLLYKKPLSPEDLAKEVNVDRNTIYKWVRAGTLPVRRAGSLLKFDPAPIADWAERREYLPIDQR